VGENVVDMLVGQVVGLVVAQVAAHRRGVLGYCANSTRHSFPIEKCICRHWVQAVLLEACVVLTIHGLADENSLPLQPHPSKGRSLQHHAFREERLQQVLTLHRKPLSVPTASDWVVRKEVEENVVATLEKGTPAHWTAKRSKTR